MIDVKETNLPGLGLRHDFKSRHGERVGVVTHRDGRRDVFVYDERDPDACKKVINLSAEESQTMADLLGGSKVTRSLAGLQQEVEGLAIDWVLLEPGSPYAGRPLGEASIRSRTGVSVVAVLRDREAFPSPSPGFELIAGDTLVAVGTPEALEATSRLLQGG